MDALYGSRIIPVGSKLNNDKLIKMYLDKTAKGILEKDTAIIRIVDKAILRGNSVIKVINEIKVSCDLALTIKKEPIVISQEAYKDLVLHAMERTYIRKAYGRKTESDFLSVINLEKSKVERLFNTQEVEKVGIATFKKGKSTIVILVDIEQNRVIGISFLYKDSKKELNSFYKMLSSLLQDREDGSHGPLKKVTLYAEDNPYIIQELSALNISNKNYIVDNCNPAIHIAAFLEKVSKCQKIEVLKDALSVWQFKVSEKRHKTVMGVVPITTYGL